MTCSARSFASAQQVLRQQRVLLLGGAAPPGAGDRVRGRPAVAHGDQRLRAGADDVEAPSGALGSRSRYMYGLGLVARSTR